MTDRDGSRNQTVDVVVVGFGAAGIAAAITAHDAGAFP
jgi:succinate dehydrogenase/fumarate reductase flavoprotein subunit